MARVRTQTHYSVQRSRKKSRFGRYLRMLLLLACMTLAFLVVKAMVMKAARPYLISYNESKERSDIQRQISQAEAENRVLRRDIAYLDTPEGKEAEARKLGWVKKGEVAVVVPDVGASPFAGEPLPQPSFWDHLGRRMAGVFVKGR